MQRTLFLLAAVCLCATSAAPTSSKWDYSNGKHGPSKWYKAYPACGDNNQSPIDIDDTEGDVNLALTFNNYDQSVSLEGTNNGHTAVFAVTSASGNPGITGEGLPTTDGSVFELVQLHFHWGLDNSEGSEHFLNGDQYPMEVHFVHYNTKYASISEAVDKADGLAVVGFFYQISNKNNTDYNTIVNALANIVNPGPTTTITVNLGDLLGDRTSTFYRYAGSLTTPPCYQSVTWTVFKEPINISCSQMMEFRALTHDDSHPIGANFRPLQPLNGRTVYANKESA